MDIYEHVSDEIDEALAFRNAIFGYISLDQWQAMGCTAVTAREDGQLVGFIPLQFREQRLRPGVTIPVVYENAVGVAEGMRGRGVGSQMIDAAAGLIQDRVDALMVIRSDERSRGYRFYRQTGHSDVSYMRSWMLLPEDARPSSGTDAIAIVDRAQWVALEAQLLALYERRYGRFGGARQRCPGYWAMVFDGHVYRARRWVLAVERDGAGRVSGYMVAAYGRWQDSRDVSVYEVVGQDDAVVERLLRYASQLGASGAVDVPDISLANPVQKLLRRLGFRAHDTSPHIMARVLRPDRIFGRLAAGSGLRDSLSLAVHTPHRSLAVNEPLNPKYSVLLETKESLLARLFLCRLDLEAAVEMEMVRWNVRDSGLARELYRVFAFADWVQWYTDYV